jgi:restriction system protein
VAYRRVRRRSSTGNTVAGWLILGLTGTAVLFSLVGAALAFLETHPLTTVVLIIGLIAVGYLVARQRIARARLAEASAAEQYRVAVHRSSQIAPYHGMTPREFEQAIAFLCHRDGCGQVQVVGGSGDLGADVTATTSDGRRVVIQAKRYGPTTKVSSPDLQRFGGTCYSIHGAHVAAVITTSVFTKQAAQYAQHMGIRLFGADELAGWITRTGPAPWH